MQACTFHIGLKVIGYTTEEETLFFLFFLFFFFGGGLPYFSVGINY